MINSKNSKLLGRILEQYKLRTNVPRKVQKNSLRIRERVLRKSLKNAGVYSVYYAIVLKIFWKVRRFGLKFSVSQSKFTAGFLLTACILSGIFAFYYSYTYTEHKKPVPVIIDKKKGIIVPDERRKQEKKKAPEIKDYTLRIRTFKSRNASDGINKQVTDNVFTYIREIRPGQVTYKEKNTRAQYVLVGSMWKLGDKYTVSVKIVNAANSEVKWATMINVMDEQDISLRKLSESVSSQMDKLRTAQ